MTRKHSAFAISGVILGATLFARQLRRLRALDLTDRIVLITGGSRGLGLLMAREVGHLGGRVVIAARDEAELLRAERDLLAHDIHASVIVADVASEEDARRIITQVIDRHGRLDVLINNAGVITVGPIDHMSVADFEEAMATNFWGPLHTMLAAHSSHARAGARPHRQHLLNRRQDRRAASGAYSASKFALTGFSEVVFSGAGAHGILVTTVCPGLMRTGSTYNAWFKGRHRAEFAWFAIVGLAAGALDRAAGELRAQIIDAMRHGDCRAHPDVASTTGGVLQGAGSEPDGEGDGARPTACCPRRRDAWQREPRRLAQRIAMAPSLLTRLSERASGREQRGAAASLTCWCGMHLSAASSQP